MSKILTQRAKGDSLLDLVFYTFKGFIRGICCKQIRKIVVTKTLNLLSGIILVSTIPCVLNASPRCEMVFAKQVHRIELSKKLTSVDGVVTFLNHVIMNEPAELLIPKDLKLSLLQDNSARIFREKRNALTHLLFSNSLLAKAPIVSDKSKIMSSTRAHLAIDLLGNLFIKPPPLEALGQLSEFRKHVDLAFTRSEFMGKSRDLFAKPKEAEKIIDLVNATGRVPFAYKNEKRDIVVTNEHFFRYLKQKRLNKILLYRGQSRFDYFYTRLLLADPMQSMPLRRDFASWLVKNMSQIRNAINLTPEQQNNFIVALKDSNVPLEKLLDENTPLFTTSVLYTSLTKDAPNYFANAGLVKSESEIITLTVDLSKLPDWYIDRIIYGSDLYTEIVFPFITPHDREVLRESVKITASNFVPK